MSKRISEMSLCSRREADEWIENGWVSVDGVVLTTLGTRVHPGAKIEIKDAASAHQTEILRQGHSAFLVTGSRCSWSGDRHHTSVELLIVG